MSVIKVDELALVSVNPKLVAVPEFTIVVPEGMVTVVPVEPCIWSTFITLIMLLAIHQMLLSMLYHYLLE